MKTIILIAIMLTLSLQAKDYRTQQERCKDTRLDLINKYQHYLHGTVQNLDKPMDFQNYSYYVKPTLEDIIRKREEMTKTCQLSHNPLKANESAIGFIQGQIREKQEIEDHKGKEGHHNFIEAKK